MAILNPDQVRFINRYLAVPAPPTLHTAVVAAPFFSSCSHSFGFLSNVVDVLFLVAALLFSLPPADGLLPRETQ